MNASKLFVVFASIFALVLASGFASATVDFVNVTGATQTLAQGSQAIVSFNVQATTFLGQINSAQLVLPLIFSSSTSWTGDTGTFTLLPDSNSTLKTIRVNVPPTQAAGVYTGQIGLTGDYNMTGGLPGVNNLTVSITVTTSSLTISAPALIFIGSNATLTLQNNGNSVLSGVVLSATSATTGLSLAFNPATLNINPNSQATTSVRATGSGLRFGSYTATVRAVDSTQTSATNSDVTIVKSFCTAGPVGNNLTIARVKVSSDGDKDEEWKPLDNIEVEVKVENIGANDIDNVIIELGLFDSAGINAVGDLDFSSIDEEQADLGDLNDGDDDTITFEFTVPADFDISSSDYKLAVKAYSDGDEDKMCIDNDVNELDNTYFESIKIDQESDEDKFIAIGNVQLPSEIVCGETATGSFEAFNIGEKDQDQVLVRMINSNLGLNQQFEIRNNMDIGDSAVIDFSFLVPRTVRDGLYPLTFRSSYDYRNGNYRQDSDDNSPASLKVIGCGSGTVTPTSNLDISIPQPDSDAAPGELFDIIVVFKNTGSESMDITLDADGYQSWADLSEISDDSFTLAADQSKSITFTMDIKEDAAGTESFTIEARSAGVVETQDVDVVLPEASKKFSLSFGSPLLWVVGAINVVLIVLIIVVAVRLARK